jgi:inosine-uridine nucleoside N-ribohydrolase
VFAAPWPIVMAPLDVCGTLQLKGEPYRRLSESEHPLASTVIANYDAWSNRKKYGADESSVLFDTVAVYLCYDDAFCEMETVKLSIDEKGATVVDEAKGRPVVCALGWKDRAAFEALLIDSLIGN